MRGCSGPGGQRSWGTQHDEHEQERLVLERARAPQWRLTNFIRAPPKFSTQDVMHRGVQYTLNYTAPGRVSSADHFQGMYPPLWQGQGPDIPKLAGPSSYMPHSRHTEVTFKFFEPNTTLGVVPRQPFVAGYNPRGCRGCDLECQASELEHNPSDTTL